MSKTQRRCSNGVMVAIAYWTIVFGSCPSLGSGRTIFTATQRQYIPNLRVRPPPCPLHLLTHSTRLQEPSLAASPKCNAMATNISSVQR